MEIKKSKNELVVKNNLPKIILIKSENPNIDKHKKSDEIRYYLAQIIILADKKGRPSKQQCPEVSNAA